MNNLIEYALKWLLTSVITRSLRNGDHGAAIKKQYKIIADIVENYYTEDNKPTINSYLMELFEESQHECE